MRIFLTLNEINNKYMEVPIFIIVHDRTTVLQRSVNSFLTKISTPIKLIFHDVASTYQPCLSYLEEMREAGHEVYRSEVNNHLTIIDTIKHYMSIHPEYEYYVVTDPDIELNNVEGDILEYYIYLSKLYEDKLVIGPMLKIDDIPDYYPYKAKMIASHTNQFWKHQPSSIVYNDKELNILPCLIDTTFQLAHRSFINNKRFPRNGIRTYEPYDARHLDWYLDPNNLTPDQEWYSKKAHRSISHWGINLV